MKQHCRVLQSFLHLLLRFVVVVHLVWKRDHRIVLCVNLCLCESMDGAPEKLSHDRFQGALKEWSALNTWIYITIIAYAQQLSNYCIKTLKSQLLHITQNGVQCKFHHCGRRLIFTSFTLYFITRKTDVPLVVDHRDGCTSTWIHLIILESYQLDYANKLFL